MSSNSRHLFTSESVTEGHPDKVADQVSDAVLDAILAIDPRGRVACETLLTTGLCIVAGEITTRGYVDIQKLARRTIEALRLWDHPQFNPKAAEGMTVGRVVLAPLRLVSGWFESSKEQDSIRLA